MPKAKQKSGLSLSSDFKKQKTKLGKGKQQANNATDTSFKSRSIALPQQSVSRDKATAPVTRRNLTLDELIGQARHYSASVRRDAVQGLEEIAVAYPTLRLRHVGVLLTTAARLIADEDAAVRKAVQGFLAFLLERTPRSQIRPYVDTLLLYTTSAMSHIFPDIRLDAVRTADVCLAHLGDIMSLGWEAKLSKKQVSISDVSEGETHVHGTRMLDCYLNLLGASLPAASAALQGAVARASVTSTDLSTGARLVILKSLASFMRASAAERSDESKSTKTICPVWYFESSFASPVDFKSFEKLFRHQEPEAGVDVVSSNSQRDTFADLSPSLGQAWTNRDVMAAISSAIGFLDSDAHSAMSDDEKDLVGPRLVLFEAIEPLLMTSLLDCAPSAFPPEGNWHGIQSVAGQIVCVVADIVLILWRGARTATPQQRTALAKLLSRMAPYFPFGGSSASFEVTGRAPEAAGKITLLNLSYCELVGLLRIVSKEYTKQIRSQLAAVNSYIIEQLAPPSGSKSVIREEAFVNILPTVWLLLDDDRQQNDELINALLEHWESLSVLDITKRLATEFVGRLILLPIHSSYRGEFRLQGAFESHSAIVRWLTSSLPRYLWELGTRAPEASDVVLELLRQVACAGEECLLEIKDLKALHRPLATFFQVKHPKKGVLMGPYVRMTDGTKRRAEAVVGYLSPLEDTLATSAFAAGAL